MRFHRNNGARGSAEWMCLLPDQSKVFCYARVVLVKDVTFEHKGLDGWALGEPKWIEGAVPPIIGQTQLDPAVAGKIRPDALARMPVDGWMPLWYRKGDGFWCYKRKLAGARWMLLAPGLVAIRRPRFA